MTEFTKEEISLCKQVTKRHKKDIEYGDWYLEPKTQRGVLLWDYEDSAYFVGDQCSDTVSLWAISDCLEFLRKEGYMVRLLEYENHSGEKRKECNCYGHKTKGAFSTTSNKDEEACLKAVLAVLGEEK